MLRWFVWLLLAGTVFSIPTQGLADVTRVNEDKKNKDRTTSFTPEARTLTVGFVAGLSVEVELSAAVGSLKRVEFMIRQEPQDGTLSELRAHPKDNNKALVTYTPKGSSTTLKDSFTYACRLDGGTISAPATVTLIGKRFDPQLEVFVAPRFDRVFLGGESTSRVLVKNQGPAPYKSALAWQAPWKGPPELEVAPGKSVEFLVTFRPDKAGNYRSQMELQPGFQDSVLFLYGDCIEVLTISPGRLALTFNAATGERAGMLTVVNTRPDPTSVALKLPARLQAEMTSLELEPLAKKEVAFKLLSTDVEAFQGEITFETGTMVEKILVVADAKPGQMRLVSPAQGPLDFGTVKRNSDAQASIALSNVGGQPIIAGARSVVPFQMEEAGQALRLEPGQQRNLTVRMDTSRAGKYSGSIAITGGSDTLTVALTGEVDEKEGPPAMVKAGNSTAKSTDTSPTPRPSRPATGSTPAGNAVAPPAKRTALVAALEAVLASEGLPKPKSAFNSYLESPTNLELVATSTKSITLAWKKPEVPPAGWRLEMSTTVHDRERNAFVKAWNPLTTWETLDSDPEKVVIRINELRPSGQYELRLFATDREGKLSEPTPAFVVETSVPWTVPPWVWRVLIIAALAIVIYVLLKIKRGEFEFEF